MTLRMRPGCTVEGVVRDRKGAPRPGVRVTLRGPGPFSFSTPAAISGVDGTFRIEGVPPGKGLAVVPGLLPGGAPSETFDLAEGETRSGVEVLDPEPTVVRGRVLDPAGAPVPGAEVRLASAPVLENSPGAWATAWEKFSPAMCSCATSGFTPTMSECLSVGMNAR